MDCSPAVLLLGWGVAAFAADLQLGKGITLKEITPLVELSANPERYAGRTVQVKGKITEVCEMMGYWMNLADPEGLPSIRVKVADGDIVFPKTSVGRMAIAEGKLERLRLNREQAVARARHEAEEQGRKFDPSSVKSGATIYQIQGTGAVILAK